MTGFWDWVGRVIMLVLAGMITLSIIGAIAAIPSGSLPQQVRLERETLPVPERREDPLPVPAPDRVQPQREAEARTAALAAAPAPEEEVKPSDWLEAITYALLALVGLVALGLVLLWRSLVQWRRGADALEALAQRSR